MNIVPNLLRYWRASLATITLIVPVADAGTAAAGTKSAPAPHASAPARPSGGAMGGGRPAGGTAGVHMPGGAGGGVHVPGSVHVPGGGGGTGGSRTQGGMRGEGGVPPGVHLPSNMQSGVRRESGAEQHGGDRRADPGHGHDARTAHAASPAASRHDAPGRGEGHGENRTAVRTGEDHQPARRNEAGHEHALRNDPRIEGTRLVHTAGITGEHVLRAGPRAFLRRDEHRDIAGERAFIHAHERDFHTRRVADFDRHELARWRAGLWRNEWHYGRRGWWWEDDGVWYAYPEPIWPYPVEVAPLVDYETPVIDGPDLEVAELVPIDVVPVYSSSAPPPIDNPAIPPLPPTPLGWYRCDQPGGYYPGIDTCGTYWALVQNAPMPGE